MLDRETLKLLARLAEARKRTEAAAALAARAGADALLVFVEDRVVDALLPAPGLPQTGVGGPTWRAFLRQCRREGHHRGEVAYPSLGTIVPAIACSGSGVVLVFVGAEADLQQIESIGLLLPLLGSMLSAEQAAAAAAGELAAAQQDARHAGELARALDTTRADLERQTKSLLEARARAEEATRAKDEFLALLGHELRNPLAPITTALQLMRLKSTKSREQDVLERQVGQLVRLVDDLLDVARIARGKVDLRKQRIELASAASRAVELAGPLLEQKRQELVVDMPSEGLPVDADTDRLAQVFSNLLTNAAKYSDAETRVTFSARADADKVVVRVQDQGQGIEPHMLEAIFDQFVQHRYSADRAQGGLGLGLAIAKNLVTLHGGTVRAISEGRGTGSVFVVELPLCKSEARSAVTRASTGAVDPPERLPRTLERVLIVDDNEEAAEMLRDALTQLGYAVRTALDGPSALAVAAEFRPQLALLDIGLPVMDGCELGRRLRESDATMRLVALTGYGQESDKARTREAGFDGHLVKPVHLDNLQRVLSTPPRAPSQTGAR